MQVLQCRILLLFKQILLSKDYIYLHFGREKLNTQEFIKENLILQESIKKTLSPVPVLLDKQLLHVYIHTVNEYKLQKAKTMAFKLDIEVREKWITSLDFLFMVHHFLPSLNYYCFIIFLSFFESYGINKMQKMHQQTVLNLNTTKYHV